MALSQAEILRKTALVINPVNGIDQPVSTATTAPKSIGGVVASTGSITAGSAFTVSTGGTGTYTVTFTAPFAATPVIVGVCNTASGAPTIAVVRSPSATGFTMQLLSDAGGGTNGPFSFLAQELG